MREAGTGQGDEVCWLRLSRAGRVRDFINVALKLLQIVEFCFNGVTDLAVFFCTESGDYTDYSDDDYLETRRRRSRRNQKRQVNYKEDSESEGSQKSVRYGKELRRVHKRRLSTSDSEGKNEQSVIAGAAVCQR